MHMLRSCNCTGETSTVWHLFECVCRTDVGNVTWSACSRPARTRWRTQLHADKAQHTAAGVFSKSSYSSFSTNKRKPRVVLIGWLGAQQRHFDKYATNVCRTLAPAMDINAACALLQQLHKGCKWFCSAITIDVQATTLRTSKCLTAHRYVQLWQKLGHETVAIRPPTPSILIPPVGGWVARDFMRKLQMTASEHPQQPVVFHAFRWLRDCPTLHCGTVWHVGLGALRLSAIPLASCPTTA